jgi:hypothetical protein
MEGNLMGVIAPKSRRGRTYFGCGGAACLGLVFWALIACCLALTVVGLSTELEGGNAELVSAFYTLSQLMAGSLAFCFSMAAILVVFVGFGFFRQTRQYRVEGESQDLNTVLLSFFLFIGGMALAAALPTLAFELPGSNGWLKAGGLLLGGSYLLYGMLMLWLTLAAYESYRHADEGEIP